MNMNKLNPPVRSRVNFSDITNDKIKELEKQIREYYEKADELYDEYQNFYNSQVDTPLNYAEKINSILSKIRTTRMKLEIETLKERKRRLDENDLEYESVLDDLAMLESTIINEGMSNGTSN